MGFVWCQQTILEHLNQLEIKNIYNHYSQDFGSHSSEQMIILLISGKGRGAHIVTCEEVASFL